MHRRGRTRLFGIGFHGCSCYFCFAGTVIHVDPDATSEEDGTTWCSAFGSLTTALGVAVPGDTVLVADGVYVPDGTGLPDSREATFRLSDKLTVLGGHAGCGEPEPYARDIRYTSVLSGDISNNNTNCQSCTADDAYHVLSMIGAGGSIIDKFTISNGNADGFSSHNWGGGLFADRAQLTVSRCSFVDNHADFGGGLAAIDSVVLVQDSLFFRNRSLTGGAAYLSVGSSATLKNCSVVFNVAHPKYLGGGILIGTGSNCNLDSSILWYNLSAGPTELAQIWAFKGFLEVNSSCIQGWSGFYGGIGNTGANPSFLGLLEGDVRLAPDSPCIDSGGPMAIGLRSDLDGHARELCAGADMGAFESGIGDADCDGLLTLFDYASLQSCRSATSPFIPDACIAFNHDNDGDIDGLDAVVFLRSFPD